MKQCSQLDEANQISGCDIYSTVNNAGSGQSTCKQCVLDKYLDNNACSTDCQTGYVKHDDGNLKQCSQLDEANQISGCDIYSSVSPDTKCLECMESFHPTDDFKKCIKTSDQTTQPTNDGQTNEFVSESMTSTTTTTMTSTTTTTMTSTTTTTMTSTTTSTMTSTITQTSNADELETNINSEDANIDGFMNESQTEFPISVPQNIYQNSNITFIQRTGKNSRVIFQDNGASNLYFRPESNDTNENPTITFSSQKSNTNNQETVVTGVMVQNQRTTNIIIESPNITLNLLADEEGEGERIANLATTNSNVSKYDINNTLLKNKQEIVIKTADPKIPVVVHELMLFNAPTFKSGSSTVSINTVKAQQGSTSTIENCKINKQVIAGLNTSLQLVGDVNISDASVEVLYNEDIDSTRPVFVGDLLSAPQEINFSKGNINEILLEDNTSNGNSVEQKEFKLIIAQNLSNCNDWKKVINFDNSPFSSVKCEKNVNGILELVVSSNKNRSMLSSGAIAGIVIACVVVVAVIVGVSVYVSRKRSLSLGIESTINDYDSIAI
ncbi:hypothetical protein TRFO_13212 [Tritrichomonas foetus]|uniref:Uncharacterized protein n=1 Tax=Tritrichomonas foetus TaxID=1144522 RepID=A0A1J4KYY8_9EUKA|nr:hypothetical protein TRFO_13212 [Tritrichomonas foetus]|eukprot:OHT16370.1 hypothetical protein TRFO_13212 [Tritrichomonas foetus]